MSFNLINPFYFPASIPAAFNTKSISFSASTQEFRINNRSNAIDTALRDTTPNFSISFWIKFDASGNGIRQDIIGKYKNASGQDRCFVIRKDATNLILFYGQYDINNTTVCSWPSATYGSGNGWMHVIFTYDCTKTTQATIAHVYINGTDITSWNSQSVNTTQKYFYNQTTEANRGRFRISCAGDDSTNSFPIIGKVDEVTFWDTTLQPNETTQLYNSGASFDVSTMTAYTASCQAWYRNGDYASDNWDGTNWNIINVKGVASTDMVTTNMANASIVTDAP